MVDCDNFVSLNGESNDFDSKTNGTEQDQIKVCVRIRPIFNSGDSDNAISWNWDMNSINLNPLSSSNATSAISRGFQSPTGTTSNRQNCSFNFDHLFHPESSNKEIFSSVVEQVVSSCMLGYHGSVFSYGQTSSGKTFTMNGNRDQPGVIPLAIQHCFKSINDYPNREFLIRVSYLEVYNEQVNDLLAVADNSKEMKEIKIMHDPKLGTVVSGAREKIVSSSDQVIELLRSGERQRHVGVTDMNEQSSRAHTLFRMMIESREKDSDITSAESHYCEGDNMTPRSVTSTLNLIDLAGSECAKMTNCKGERAREGKHINQSLLTLSTIIQRLSEDTCRGAKKQHLPYRDSKLTRILESALDGNAKIAIICTISPSARCVDESINTLKFAARAKLIRTSAKVNEVMDEKSLLRTYKEEIRLLREKLLQMERRESFAAPLLPLPDQEAALQECSRNFELQGLELPDMQCLDSNDEEVMLQMIAEMETLILKADLSSSERHQLMSLSFDLDDANFRTSKKRFSSAMENDENGEEMSRKQSRDEDSTEGVSFTAAQRLLLKKAPLGSPPLMLGPPSTYIESRLREMQRNADTIKEQGTVVALVEPSSEASQAFKKRKTPLQALSLGDSCDELTSAESEMDGCCDVSTASANDRLGLVPVSSPSRLFRYNSPNKRWRQSKGCSSRSQGIEGLSEEHDGSILFGVTKILSVLKGYIATTKSRRSMSASASGDSRMSFSSPSGKSHMSIQPDSSLYQSDDGCGIASSDRLSMLSSRDDQDLGPLAQAQYVRLKVDMQITEEENLRLRQQLYDRESLLFLLADGQKEVDAIRSQWIRSQEELQAIKNENETLKRQVMESNKVVESVFHLIESTDKTKDISTHEKKDSVEKVVAVLSDDDGDIGVDSTPMIEPPLDLVPPPAELPQDEAGTTPTTKTITIPLPPTSGENLIPNLPKLTAEPCNEYQTVKQNQPELFINHSNHKNKENNAPLSHHRIFRPALL